MSKARECGTKNKHADKAAARDHMHSLIRRGAHGLSIYRCDHCASWHVGHAVGQKKRRRNSSKKSRSR